MKIFKNGIDVKWIAVFFIGIALGIGITTAYPDIGDPNSYFGNIHGNGGNLTNLPAAQIVGNFTQRINFTNAVYAIGLTATSGSDDAACIDPTTNEVTRNVALTSCAASTKKNKENIQTLEQTEIAPEKFNVLRPVKFNFKGESKERVGLIAEEVILVYPQVVGKDAQGNIRGINYEQFVPILIEKIQAQDEVINQQSILINKQSEAINKLIVLQSNASRIETVQTINITNEPTKWYEFWKW